MKIKIGILEIVRGGGANSLQPREGFVGMSYELCINQWLEIAGSLPQFPVPVVFMVKTFAVCIELVFTYVYARVHSRLEFHSCVKCCNLIPSNSG